MTYGFDKTHAMTRKRLEKPAGCERSLAMPDCLFSSGRRVPQSRPNPSATGAFGHGCPKSLDLRNYETGQTKERTICCALQTTSRCTRLPPPLAHALPPQVSRSPDRRDVRERMRAHLSESDGRQPKEPPVWSSSRTSQGPDSASGCIHARNTYTVDGK